VPCCAHNRALAAGSGSAADEDWSRASAASNPGGEAGRSGLTGLDTVLAVMAQLPAAALPQLDAPDWCSTLVATVVRAAASGCTPGEQGRGLLALRLLRRCDASAASTLRDVMLAASPERLLLPEHAAAAASALASSRDSAAPRSRGTCGARSPRSASACR
jgi:hypothetical protein